MIRPIERTVGVRPAVENPKLVAGIEAGGAVQDEQLGVLRVSEIVSSCHRGPFEFDRRGWID